jgi:hypothetical protein
MRHTTSSLLLAMLLALPAPALALGSAENPHDAIGCKEPVPGKLVLIAAGKKKGGGKKGGKGVREKFINGEATLKSKDQTKVDFEAADIGGERKTPLGTLINQNKADKNYDFVKIRLRWHPEMVQSASSLDAGGQ